MDQIAVQVKCYSGYKAEEYPLCFYWNDSKFEIDQVLDRWHQWAYSDEWPLSDYFKVHTVQGHRYILKHELEQDKWFLLVHGESISV